MTLAIMQYGHGGTDVLRRVEMDIPPPTAGTVMLRQAAVGFKLGFTWAS